MSPRLTDSTTVESRFVGEDKELGFGGADFAVSVGQSSGQA